MVALSLALAQSKMGEEMAKIVRGCKDKMAGNVS